MARVLIIDDDVDMAGLLRITLEKAGFEIFYAVSGNEGIAAVKTLHPEVIVLDIMMPDMDGIQVCDEIRKFSHIPILILSVITKPSLIAEALDHGADDYLAKPITNGVLIAHLNNLARRLPVSLSWTRDQIAAEKNTPLNPGPNGLE